MCAPSLPLYRDCVPIRLHISLFGAMADAAGDSKPRSRTPSDQPRAQAERRAAKKYAKKGDKWILKPGYQVRPIDLKPKPAGSSEDTIDEFIEHASLEAAVQHEMVIYDARSIGTTTREQWPLVKKKLRLRADQQDLDLSVRHAVVQQRSRAALEREADNITESVKAHVDARCQPILHGLRAIMSRDFGTDLSSATVAQLQALARRIKKEKAEVRELKAKRKEVEAELSAATVGQLRETCKAHGLATHGIKKELKARLLGNGITKLSGAAIPQSADGNQHAESAPPAEPEVATPPPSKKAKRSTGKRTRCEEMPAVPRSAHMFWSTSAAGASEVELPEYAAQGIRSAVHAFPDGVFVMQYGRITNLPDGAQTVDANEYLSEAKKDALLARGWHIAHVADVVRFIAAARNGGWVVDADTWWLKEAPRGLHFATLWSQKAAQSATASTPDKRGTPFTVPAATPFAADIQKMAEHKIRQGLLKPVKTKEATCKAKDWAKNIQDLDKLIDKHGYSPFKSPGQWFAPVPFWKMCKIRDVALRNGFGDLPAEGRTKLGVTFPSTQEILDESFCVPSSFVFSERNEAFAAKGRSLQETFESKEHRNSIMSHVLRASKHFCGQ